MTCSDQLTRRQFASTGFAAAALWISGRAQFGWAAAPGDPGSIVSIEPLGMLIRECSLPGETRAEGVVPRHANCIQLSRERWLVVYSTHGYRGVDDERSIVYQLRAGAPDGRVVKEGFFMRGAADWHPPGVDLSGLGPNHTLYKQHGHMVAFGVPQGATIDGRPVAHAGVFVAKWRVSGRALDKDRNYLEHSTAPGMPHRAGQGVEWTQFRLNGTADDLEILQPAGLLRQAGYEEGPAFTSASDVAWMNQSFVPAVPFNGEASEWADVNHFDGGRIAALKYRFNPRRGVYAWIEIGPRLPASGGEIFEAGLARVGDAWVISSRRQKAPGVAWFRTADPFAGAPAPVLPDNPKSSAPLTIFVCADGVLRLFTGDSAQSPYRNGRDPLFCWDVDVDHGYACTNRREIFDSVKAGLPIRKEVWPKLDFCELFPQHDGTQLVVFGLSTRGYNFPYVNRPEIPAINEAEKAAAGVYHARIKYRDPIRARWQFS